MKKTMIQSLVLLMLPFGLFAQRNVSIFFETKQTTLTVEAKTQLTALVVEIKTQKINKINIIGFADTDGSDALNQNLSEQRAVIVKAFLVEKGIANDLISASGRGKVGADKDKNRSRRVDILVDFVAPNTAKMTAAPSPPSKPIPNITALYQALGTPVQTFKIATNRDTLLRGAKGTAIFVPKNVFEGVPPNATVDFRLKEAYSTADILADNLNTTSGSQLLQTGGMIYTDAQYNGKPIALKDNLLVSFASAESRQEGMQIYSGKRNPQQNGKIDWRLAPKELEETVAYMLGDSDSPYVMRNGEKSFAKFAEWVDVSPCGVYFKNTDGKQYAKNVEPNATCATIIARVEAQPNLKTKSIDAVHRLIFSDMYAFYNVNTLLELQKQDGSKWDSLLAVRERTYDLTAAGDVKRQQKADSLNEVRKKEEMILREQLKRENDRRTAESFFPVKQFGWTNLDRLFKMTNYQPKSLVTMTMDIPLKNSYFYSVVLTFPKFGMTIQAYQNKEALRFMQLPEGLEGYVVGMKTENNQPYLAIQKIKTDNVKVDLDYKPMTAAEIKQAFSELK